MSELKPQYSGPNKTGICKCDCSWEDHHLGMVMNEEYVNATGEAYIAQECTKYGFNEVGGMKYNKKTKEWEDHCYGYKDKEFQG
jgi:hypothetical protein